jgi:alpha-mannosidase
MWNDTNRFPYHIFVWEGIDGTEIPVHIIVATYNGTLASDEVKRVWDEYGGKDLAPAIHSYGIGDGGGGPSVVMLERIRWINRLPKLPRLQPLIREEEYIELLKKASEKAPRWRGELYVEIHRGTYTTNHKIKELVYRAEECLRTAEVWSSISSSKNLINYPREDLRKIWEALLRAEFHDILPGSASYEAYLEAFKELEEAIEMCEEISKRAVTSIARGRGVQDSYIAVFNSLPWARRSIVELPKGVYRYIRYSGGSAPMHQDLGESVLVEIEIPATGYVMLERSDSEILRLGSWVTAIRDDKGVIIDNGILRVLIGLDGLIEITDTELGTRIVHSLRAHRDKPGDWDAWDIERSSIEETGDMLTVSDGPSVIYGGPLKACARLGYSYKGSRVIQTICLSRGSRIAEISARIKWISRGYLLKAWLRPSHSFDEVIYEIPFGSIRRSSKPRDSWDRGKFEAPALRWVDISDGSRGFAIISMTRHGYSPRGDEVGLTLAKTPLFPDPYSGLEDFEARYYIYTHKGNYIEGEVPRVAYELWSPPRVVSAGVADPLSSFIAVEGGAILESIKLAEDGGGIVLRIYNPGEKHANARINLWDVFYIYEGDLLERIYGDPIARGSSFEISLRPFEIRTFILRPGIPSENTS